MSRPIVIKLGGRAIDQPRRNATLWHALATLAKRHAGGVVIVHGGGGEVDRLLARLGMRTEKRDGIRITPPETIGDVTGALAGTVNKALVGALIAAGARAVGLSLGDGGFTVSEVDHSLGFDAGRVGRVDRGDPTLIDVLLENGFLPVIACIGMDETGHPLNVNADDAAAAVARVIDAEQLVLLTDVQGVHDGSGALISELACEEVEARIESGVIREGMAVKTRAAARAAAESDRPVVIASWESPERLWLLASENERIGTRVIPRRRSVGG